MRGDNNLGEAPRRLYRRLIARRNDGPGNPASMALLAELAKDLCHVVCGSGRNPVGCTHPCANAHAHVERTITQKTESARRIVELGRRHSEIHEDAVDEAAGHVLPDDLGNRIEGPLVHRYAGVLSRKRARRRNGLRITINGDQHAAGTESLENSTCMTATAEGGVDNARIRTHR